MRYIIGAILLLLLQILGGNGISIPANNGYVHMSADTPELIAIFKQVNKTIPITGTPSIMLPYNLTESIRGKGDISIEIRLKMFNVIGLPQLLLAPTFDTPGSGAYQSPVLYYGDDSKVHFLFYDASGPPATTTIVNLYDGKWHMISAVLSFSQNYYRIYIDGVDKTMQPPRQPAPYSWVDRPYPPPVHLLASGGCKYDSIAWPGFPMNIQECFFNGYIDEFRIWSKTIESDQVLKNLESNLFGDEDGLAYLLSFDELLNDGQEYFPGLNSTLVSYLFPGPKNTTYNQTAEFIPSSMTLARVFVDLNATHVQTTIIYNNPSSTPEFHPYGRNNYFLVNGTERVLNMGQPQTFPNGSTTFTLVWQKTNGTTLMYKFGGIALLSMSADTPAIMPPITTPPVEPIAIQEPLAIVNPNVPSDDQTVAIAVGVTVPLVVVGVGAALLAVFLIRRKKKAAKEKTFAEKQGAIIQSRKVQIMNKIGSGSFGDVWKGLWRGKEVAIKEVKSGADASFLNEIKIMAKLPPNENVMEVYGAIIDADSPSLVLEYCGGGSLDFLLYDSDVPITEEQMLKLALGIARGMEHLHKYNIVHRDLAARNVLLTTDHVPKICDFGMSRTVAERNASNKTKNDMGPIRWMAPEALESEYSTKTDVWSYGIVLSEITSRREPHTDVDPLKIALQIRDEKMTPKIVDTCPPALADLMKMCWNPVPSERPEFTKIVELLELVVQKK